MSTTAPIASIIINRDERQRRDLTNLEELEESISRIGLINPIVVTRDMVLVAGERRFTSCRNLGWTSIPVTFVDDLDEFQLQAIELEENIKREALSWQDTAAAIQRYHNLRKQMDPAWTQDKTADDLGIKRTTVTQYLMVAEAYEAGVKRVVEAPKYSVALNVARREQERKRAEVKTNISQMLDINTPGLPEPSTPNVVPLRKVPLLHADFNEWAPAYTERPFNLLHCDFPYGVNANEHAQGAGSTFGGYEDSEDVYWTLLDTLAGSMDNLVASSAHLIFWFSMDFYQRTFDRLTEMGWRVNPFPLIWYKSDNTGILPDPNRGPRRIYETAFFAARGDRKLTANGAVANAFAHPGRDKSLHMSEKPVPMLKHFMRMVVDEYTFMLDPTAGSANALKAATALGAPTVLGLEKDAEFFERSVAGYESDDTLSSNA